MCIWKQWKLPRTRKRKLLGLGLPEWVACAGAYNRKGYWRMAGSGVLNSMHGGVRGGGLITPLYSLGKFWKKQHKNFFQPEKTQTINIC